MKTEPLCDISSGLGHRCCCRVATIASKVKEDGFSGAHKLRNNIYVLFPIRLIITAACFSFSISLAMKYCSTRSTYASQLSVVSSKASIFPIDIIVV